MVTLCIGRHENGLFIVTRRLTFENIYAAVDAAAQEYGLRHDQVAALRTGELVLHSGVLLQCIIQTHNTKGDAKNAKENSRNV